MKTRHGKSRTIPAILIAVAILAVIATVTAEFVKSSRVKRVIAANVSIGMLFSSNYMRPGAKPNDSTIYVDQSVLDDDSVTYFDTVVTVSNHAQGNPTRTYARDITYTMTASIVRLLPDGLGNTNIVTATGSLPAVKINGEAMRASYSGTLTAGGESTDQYQLSLPKSMLTGEKYYVLLTATPTGGAYADLAPISAVIDVAIKPDSVSYGWSLDATDNRSYAVSQYDGYNFRLSGSGAGTVMLAWDGSKLDISKVFRQSVSAVTPAAGDVPAAWSGLSVIQFSVDSDAVNSYDIQFYDHSTGSVASWSDVTASMLFLEASPSP